MTVYTDLQTAWTTLIAAQYAEDGDALRHATALVDLTHYIAALQAQAKSAASSDVVSYSIAGRSVTRSSAGDSQSSVDYYRLRLERYCGHGISIVDDFRTEAI